VWKHYIFNLTKLHHFGYRKVLFTYNQSHSHSPTFNEAELVDRINFGFFGAVTLLSILLNISTLKLLIFFVIVKPLPALLSPIFVELGILKKILQIYNHSVRPEK